MIEEGLIGPAKGAEIVPDPQQGVREIVSRRLAAVAMRQAFEYGERFLVGGARILAPAEADKRVGDLRKAGGQIPLSLRVTRVRSEIAADRKALLIGRKRSGGLIRLQLASPISPRAIA